jgi:predicted  nucleic acid-binding Zn-ribbon protein
MKKYLFIILAAVAATGCHDYKADCEVLTRQKDSLITEANYKDSAINAFIAGVNQVETNLKAINEKQAELSDMTSQNEMNKSQFDRINDNITNINALMEANRNQMETLKKKLGGANFKVKELEKTLASLQQQLDAKNAELASLNQKITELNTTVDGLNTNVKTLTATTEEQAKTIADKTTKLNTAYYTTGTYKELETKKVLNKEGGFLGIGKNKKLINDFKSDAFTMIDITQTKTIELNAKSAKVISTHPSNSYKIDMKDKNHVNNLTITDPDQFWKASKYLVVMIEK